ncbi:MAG: hypothetical protein P8Q14_04195 [Vicingaceae bacterium]|nr:hypothetical protein [Vicingaceae bacterium]
MQKNKIFIVVLLVLGSVIAFAQPTTISPYSKYGPGLLRVKTFTRSFAMGGAGIGLRSNREIGLINPASYSALVVTTFDVGYTSNSLWLSDGVEKQSRTKSYIDHIAFAFPVVKNAWGMSFGFLPYSNTGYNYNEVIEDPIAGSVSLFENGDGAINKAYFGNGFAVNLDSSSHIAFGVNASFLFGAINSERTFLYGDLPGAYNVINQKRVGVSDFGYDFGLQYKKTFEKEDEDRFILVLGATYELAADIKTITDEEQLTFSGVDEVVLNEEIEDIIFQNRDVEGVMQLPSEIGFGASLEKEHKWIITADYKMADWGSILSNDPVYNYKSNSSIHVGAQFIPKHDGQSYLSRMAYRVGARYANSHLEINNINWNEYGITFGMGLPVRRSENSYPRLNFGFEYGKRGTTDGGLIQEDFFNLNVGLTINATWFRKRKYD